MTSAVSPAELGRLQADSARWFTEAVSIVRLGRAPDGKGGYTNTKTTIWTGSVGRKPLSEIRAGRQQDTGDLATTLQYWAFSFPAGVDVHPADEIHAGSRVYEVTAGMDKSLEIMRAVVAKERL